MKKLLVAIIFLWRPTVEACDLNSAHILEALKAPDSAKEIVPKLYDDK